MSRDIKDIATTVRKQLKKEFPKCTFSVKIERYSMGQSMHVALMKAPFEVFRTDADTNGNVRSKAYAQLNQYQLRDPYSREKGLISNGNPLTEDAWWMLKRADEIANVENWDNSDIMTDYFDVNYYLHLAIGKWNKPFEVA